MKLASCPSGHILYWGNVYGWKYYAYNGSTNDLDERREWICYKRFWIIPWKKWLRLYGH